MLSLAKALTFVDLSTPYLGGYSAEVPPLPIPNRVVKLSIADGTALRCGRVGSRHFERVPFGTLFFCVYTTLPRRSAVPRVPMCTACVVPVKRLRRTVNFPGTFEGVSAPREFAQPSLLSKHRTPYGSRHFQRLISSSHLGTPRRSWW